VARYKLLTADQVEKGALLPPLAVQVSATTVVLGAMASRDWRPLHHDRDFAIQRIGTRDIFLNAPAQAAWFERYLTDWSGPRGRIGRMKFRMRDPVFPGDTMTFGGVVEKVESDARGCAWAEVALSLRVGEQIRTSCQARIALPMHAGDNPWARRGDDWKP
jgi:acyl dehydratase